MLEIDKIVQKKGNSYNSLVLKILEDNEDDIRQDQNEKDAEATRRGLTVTGGKVTPDELYDHVKSIIEAK